MSKHTSPDTESCETDFQRSANKASLNERVKQGVIYAMRLLTISKRSESHLRRKLADKGYGDEAIESVIEKLKQNGVIDDPRLAANFVYWSAQGAGLGRNRIRFELRKRGLGEGDIASALTEYDRSTESKLAYEAGLDRFQKLNKLDKPKRRKRVYDYLIRRGFDYELARDVIKKIEQGQ